MCLLKDIHTHHLPCNAQEALLSVCYDDISKGLIPQAAHLSVGIHPWYLTEETYSIQLEWVHTLLQDKRVLALGEAGLDKCCGTPMVLQEKAFRSQIELSETFRLPLIIHAVKCMDELIRLKKEYQPDSPWILHGFRGKPQQAVAYVRHGFYLSFGEKYAEESLQAIPLERLFLETDESNVLIEALYQRAASVHSLSVAALKDSVLENINRVFY